MEKIIYWYGNFEQGDWSGKRSCGGTLTSARLRLGSLPDGLTNDCGQINSMEHLIQTLRLRLTLCDERRINDRNGSTVKSIIYIQSWSAISKFVQCHPDSSYLFYAMTSQF
jgi:hypothetical protein